jgi:phosphate transport system permease protein
LKSTRQPAGVPSIIYGLMALGSWWGLGMKRSVLVGGLTLGLLVLPIVIVATREACRHSSAIREASYAAGPRSAVVRYHLLPYSLGGLLREPSLRCRGRSGNGPLITIGL